MPAHRRAAPKSPESCCDSTLDVVTGGGNGIGRHLVFDLLRRGASVAAVDIRQESLDETASLVGSGAVGPMAPGIEDRLGLIFADVTDRAVCDRLPERVANAFGPADCLINNAGIIQPFVRFNDLEFDDIDRVVRVNLYGPLHMTKAFLPGLLERPEAHIANVSSMGGFLPVPGQTVYGATKAAIKLLTEGLHVELLETNVGVSVIMPGGVSTDITANSGVEAPTGVDADDPSSSRIPTTTPSDAATIILDGIEDNELYIHVGMDSKLLHLATRTAPKRAAHLIARQMKSLLD
ncbi:MAG: SDR family oxidoreductase [Acidimicrobiia bacterium]|nr:SDR family oxidoreductase [Acidimicrobiia bacterium]